MAIKDDSALKSEFQAGDRPSQQAFADLIDSKAGTKALTNVYTVLTDRVDNLGVEAGNANAEVTAARTAIPFGTAPASLSEALRYATGNRLNVLAWGAVGNGSTDDATAIQACFNAAATGDMVWFPPGYNFAVASGVVAPNGIHIIMDSPITYTGSGNIVTLTVGVAGSHNNNVTLKLNVTRASISSWTNDGSIAIRLHSANYCHIHIVQASMHTIGLQCMGTGKGFAYNNVFLNFVYDNKIQVDITTDNAGGWCNDNNFFGGRFGVSSDSNTTVSAYGVRITSTAGYYSRNNVFHKPSFEMNISSRTGGAEGVPVLIEYGLNNHFKDCRDEFNSDTFARVSNDSYENTFSTGYGTTGFLTVEDTSTSPSSVKSNVRTRLIEDAKRLIWSSGFMPKTWCYYDGATQIHIPNVQMEASATYPSAPVVDATRTSVSGTTTYISVGSARSLGVYIDTRNVKRFVIRADCLPSQNGRFGVRAYDSSGSVLVSGTHVTGLASATFTYSSTFGGHYHRGGDSDGDCFFAVADTVDYVAIVYRYGGTNSIHIRSLSVWTMDPGETSWWLGYEPIVPGANIGSAAPTAGTWIQGRRVYIRAATAGGTEGWVCVATGTPGTWKTFGVIAA